DAFLVAASDTCMERSSADLMAQVFPDVPFSRPVDGTDTLLSIDKARTVLGYEPAYTWREQL
ncbi:MAG: NAD(P)-dependent oxidoreductase, partial [Acidimicrobiia bacterium]|nr:NAD(P)-dependent oxidoreductase [Acidimicrobiia bacterium]